MRIVNIGLFALLTIGCTTRHTVPYNVVIATDNGFKIIEQTFSSDHFIDNHENGLWTFKVDSLIYSTGDWDAGLKTKNWKYDLGQKRFEIDFNTHYDTLTDFKISYPKFWSTPSNKIKNAIFLMGDTTISSTHDNKLFVVLAQPRRENNIDLETYNQFYIEKMRTDSCSEFGSWLIKSNERQYYLNRFVINENGEQILILNLNLETDNLVYDITFKTLNQDIQESFLRFFEIVLTAKHGQFRLFNPLDIIKNVVPIRDKATAPNTGFV